MIDYPPMQVHPGVSPINWPLRIQRKWKINEHHPEDFSIETSTSMNREVPIVKFTGEYFCEGPLVLEYSSAPKHHISGEAFSSTLAVLTRMDKELGNLEVAGCMGWELLYLAGKAFEMMILYRRTVEMFSTPQALLALFKIILKSILFIINHHKPS